MALEDYNSELLREINSDLRYGKMIAHPCKGDELVISGMAGRFPESDNVYQYRDNLINKVDMVTSDYRRWKSNHSEIPQRTGKINLIDKFDNGFFGIHSQQIQCMDPVGRLLLEHAFEAILDAGLHPDELIGTKTGVFTAACIAESEKSWFFKNLTSPSFAGTGCGRSVQANWISHFFQLEGPSVSVDTACSSSLSALDLACKSIRLGKCDAAIVGSGNLCMHPMTSLQFFRVGVLSSDGTCKSFDKDADGYARSEAVSVIFLQKAKDARRIYAHVLHTKINCDGHKEHGITFPSRNDQKRLLSELYHECSVNPASIDFFEAHMTGTKVGDQEEVAAIDQFYCQAREQPLHVGSVKSNHGHTEPVSGFCSVIKVLLSMENNCFLPNLNYTESILEPFLKKRMVVVTEPLKWTGKSGMAAINNFGFGGANAHVLLKRHFKVKSKLDDDLPRLVCYSGRTERAVDGFRDDLLRRQVDSEFVGLLHAIFGKAIKGHSHRGFCILSKTGVEVNSSAWTSEKLMDLCLILSGPSHNYLDYVKSLCKFPEFGYSVQRIQKTLPVKFDVKALIMDEWTKCNVNLITATILAQIVLIDFLKLVNVRFGRVYGYSLGSIPATYANGTLTLEEVVLLSHYFVEVLGEYNNNHKVYADRNNFIRRPAVNPKNHLKEQVVTTANDAFLDVYLKHKDSISNKLLKPLQNLIKSPQDFIDQLFMTQAPKIAFPLDSVVLHVGSHVEHLINKYVNIVDLAPSTKTQEHFLETLGQLYELGFNPKIENLYPQIQWPVSSGTPMISPLIKWDHESTWFIAYFKVQEKVETGETSIMFSSKETDWAFVTGHVIDGRNLLPATGYLNLVWDAFSLLQELSMSECSVIFQNVRFHCVTKLSKDQAVKLFISIQRKTGVFEVAEVGQVIVSGTIYRNHTPMSNLPICSDKSDEMVMSKKDIYKELKLRGYDYSGLFQALTSCNLNITKGNIEWYGNWTSFMDNMLQIKILQMDTRCLYVPTYIDQLYINTEVHKKFLGETEIPVYVHKDIDIIRSAGVEIKGLKATAIAKRKTLGEPVLESYQFVPLSAKLSLIHSVRVNVQIILENNLKFKFKSVELLDDTKEPILPLLQQALDDQLLIQPDLTLLTTKSVTYDRITVKDKQLSSETENVLVIGSGILTHDELLKEALKAVKDNGFIITRETVDFNTTNSSLNILTAYVTPQEKLILFKKNFNLKTPQSVNLSNSTNFSWLTVLQYYVKNNKDLMVVSENDPTNGVLGLINCLRREPYSQKPRCTFIMDEKAPPFNILSNFYVNHIKKGLVINVYKNGCWGTYRHLPIEKNKLVKRKHIFNNVLTIGDLSSLTWVEGPLTATTEVEPEQVLIKIVYSALNFRDIMTASGRIHTDIISSDRLEQQILLGLEFSGTLPCGKRVMGVVKGGALATMAVTNPSLVAEIPEQWSFEDAATVCVTYCTTLLSLEEIGRIKPGLSILIHAGSGGIGISAINIALHYKCTIFTTVGTAEKRSYILKHFPEIPESHIGNSRDTTFEQLIMKKTNGRGVDLILNSLAKEKLQASARCLAPKGKFLEIGKFDLQSNNKLSASFFDNGCSYHGIMLDIYFDKRPAVQAGLFKLLRKGINAGYVKPLRRTIFEKNQIEQAFRYMAGGKHIGKVLIKIREDDAEVFEAVPRFFCNENFCSVIVGGLGGFGLELADWLVVRGCKKLVLVSRSGLRNGYESYKILNWKKYGVTTQVSTEDVTTKQGCQQLIKEANKLGQIENIFNLAVVLKDAVLEYQSERNFQMSFGPKAMATKLLDECTRIMCPFLNKFVVFSSVVAGRGHAGQTNYGMANSVMERVCEQRRSDGYHALAIQWGSVGDVGLMVDRQERKIEGTLHQNIISCLSVLDTFLNQNEAVVSSMVVAEKKSSFTGAGTVMDALMKIMGIKDLKSVGIHTSLSKLGMDSIMSVEIKQILEREYDVVLTAQDVRALTFSNLQQMGSQNTTKSGSEVAVRDNMTHLFSLNVSEEKDYVPVVKMKSAVSNNASAACVLMLPGVDGQSNILETLAANLACHVFCVQYDCVDCFKCTVESIAEDIFKNIEDYLFKPDLFTVVAYSLGCVFAMQLVSLLELRGFKGRLILIDGSPNLVKHLVASVIPDVNDENVFQTHFVNMFAKSYHSLEHDLKIQTDLLQCKDIEERIDSVLKYLPNRTPSFLNYLKKVIKSGYAHVRSTTLYNPKFEKLQTPITLIKPEQQLLPGFPHDYGLQECCQCQVQIHSFSGNHITILRNSNVAAIINVVVKQT